uniref:THAP-type domain-containing protein n=1 Tax=Xiphophorus maculatus TaxID=8083 RepID=A0A3B5QSV4_XIPMA
MVQTCCVIGCNVRSHDRKGKKMENGLSFHCFPAWKQREGAKLSELTKRRRMAWISAVRRPDITFSNIPRYLKVCSRHFHSGKPAYEMYELNPDWFPTLNLGHCEGKATTSDRHARQLKRPYSSAVEGQAAKTMVDQQVTESPEEVNNENTNVTCVRREEINRLLQENRELRSQLNKKQLDTDYLKDDTKKVKYIGLPCFVILLSLFNTVRPFLPASTNLSQFQMVLLALMRLRLDLPVQHLCHLFNVSHKTLSSAFADTLDVQAHNRKLVFSPMYYLGTLLADRGFDIKDSVGKMCAEVKMPSFTKGRCQLDAKDVEDTRALAHLRIHVERVIGCMRNKYKMLHRTTPIKLLLTCEGEEVTRLDKIVYVCCSLVNMCSSVAVKPHANETCTC